MDEYTIYCTKEQTLKALELGASINIRCSYNGYHPLPFIKEITIEPHHFAEVPTAEQMVGWLQSKGCYPYTMPLKRDGKVMFAARFEFFEDGGSTDIFCGYGKDNSVILKAINSALTYLSNKK